jgi:putative ABC transport system ATP-binding protein
MSYTDPPSDLLIINQDKVIFTSGIGKLTTQSEISATITNVLTQYSQKILSGDQLDSIRFDNHKMVFLHSENPKFPTLAAVILVPIEVSVKNVLPRMKIILNLMEEYLQGKIYNPQLPQLDCFNRIINFPSQALFLLPKTAEGVQSALVLLACFAHDFQISLEKITSRMFFVVKDDYLALENIIEKFDNLGVLSFFSLPSHLKNPPNKFCEIGHKSSIRQFFSAIHEEKPFQTFARLVGSTSNAFKMKSFIENDEALEIMQSIASLDKVYDVYVRNEILQATVMNPGRDIITTLSSPLLKKMMEMVEQKEVVNDNSRSQITQHRDLDQVDGFIKLRNVNRIYKMGNQQIYALKDISLDLKGGQLVVVLGPSGSGKTTLLNVIGGIDKCEGTIEVGGLEVTKLSKGKLTKYRREKCGFIFQFFNLIPVLTAMENIEYAVELSKNRKMSQNEVRIKTEEYINKIGLWEKRFMFPSQLSGGEQQQVAAARAFAKEPDILLCDEPTGELSVTEGKKVLAIIQGIIKERPNMLVILVTHNQKISLIGNKVIRLRSGKIDSINSQTPTPAQNITW